MPKDDQNLFIAVLIYGWVIVGEKESEDNHFVFRNTKVIRTWGTTKGLGELALKGPTPSTVLENAGTIHVSSSSIVLQIECRGDQWQSS
jgi:hypothetical protein